MNDARMLSVMICRQSLSFSECLW